MGLQPNPALPPHGRLYNGGPSQTKQVRHKSSLIKHAYKLFVHNLSSKGGNYFPQLSSLMIIKYNSKLVACIKKQEKKNAAMLRAVQSQSMRSELCTF